MGFWIYFGIECELNYFSLVLDASNREYTEGNMIIMILNMKNPLSKWYLLFCVLWRPSQLVSVWWITHLTSFLKLLVQCNWAFLKKKKEKKLRVISYRKKITFVFLGWKTWKNENGFSGHLYMNWFMGAWTEEHWVREGAEGKWQGTCHWWRLEAVEKEWDAGRAHIAWQRWLYPALDQLLHLDLRVTTEF